MDAFGGSVMAGGLMLGPVAFQRFEVPERIQFGGRQRLAVHLMPGGGRIVDVMGADEGPVTWSGVFSGPEAAERVRLLERLRRDGALLGLSWEGWRFTVVIESFEAEAMNPAWIPYRIRTFVIATGALAALEEALAPATLGEALALGAGPGVDGRIDAATAVLFGDDVAEAIEAAGLVARLVAGRAFSIAAVGT